MNSLVTLVAESVGPAKVLTVRIEVGRLASAAPDALWFCFDACAHGTVLEGARLDIIHVEGRGHCRRCRSEFAIPALPATCTCGSSDVHVDGRGDLRIKEVELE